MTPFRNTMAFLAILLLTGCGGILGLGGTQPLDAYELRAPAQMAQATRTLARSLVIETPGGGGGVSTDRILIRPTPLQAAYLPGARWTDEAPLMVQGLLVRAFEDTNALRYVGRRALPGGFADFILVSDLTDFQAEVLADESVQARVRLTARLVRDEDGQVLATRTFQATAPAASDDALQVVEAFNAATSAVLRDLTGWAVERMGARLAAVPGGA